MHKTIGPYNRYPTKTNENPAGHPYELLFQSDAYVGFGRVFEAFSVAFGQGFSQDPVASCTGSPALLPRAG